MAVYHFHARIIGRATGRSVVAAAAYRAAERIEDERLGVTHDFTDKAAVIHSEIMLPEGANARLGDRAILWNEVERIERRKDAQLARDFEITIPRELSKTEGIELARAFVLEQFVARGMVADLNVHWPDAADGDAQPHAHVLVALRHVGPEGFGGKAREWNDRALVPQWRERWAEMSNVALATAGHDVRIDHRSYAEQGIALTPQTKRGGNSEGASAREHEQTARENGNKIERDPTILLDALTKQQSTFTRRDLARFVNRNTADGEQFARVLAVVEASPDLVKVGVDEKGVERLSTRDMIRTESRMIATAADLATRKTHMVEFEELAGRNKAEARAGIELTAEQRHALWHVVRGPDLALVTGVAGSGKSTMLKVANLAWTNSGYRVIGATLAGIAAAGLQEGSGITSSTIASLEYRLNAGTETLGPRDVVVIDEAAMLGSRQLDRVLTAVRDAGAKAVLIGDAEQLQAIAAGAAFRALTERHAPAEITEVRRQKTEWMRQATMEFSRGETGAALARYEAAGAVKFYAKREHALVSLVHQWAAEHKPGETRMIFTATNEDVGALNQLARTAMRDAGMLGADVEVTTEFGPAVMAAGDRVLLRRNERALGGDGRGRGGVTVRNGTQGTLERVSASGDLALRLDTGETAKFNLADYGDVQLGYASTVHAGQGATIDRAYVLASEYADAAGTYVAMSRHRIAATLFGDQETFADRTAMSQSLSQTNVKDTSLDYGDHHDFAERRGFLPSASVARPLSAAEAAPASLADALARAQAARGRPGRGTPRPAAPAPESKLTAEREARDFWRQARDALGPVAGHTGAERPTLRPRGPRMRP